MSSKSAYLGVGIKGLRTPSQLDGGKLGDITMRAAEEVHGDSDKVSMFSCGPS